MFTHSQTLQILLAQMICASSYQCEFCFIFGFKEHKEWQGWQHLTDTQNFAGALTFLSPVTSQELDSFTFSSMYNASVLRERPFSEILGLRVFMCNLQTVMLRACKFYITFHSTTTTTKKPFKQNIFILKFINLHFTKDILESAMTVLSFYYYWSKPRALQLLVQENGDFWEFSPTLFILTLVTGSAPHHWALGKQHTHVLSTKTHAATTNPRTARKGPIPDSEW